MTYVLILLLAALLIVIFYYWRLVYFFKDPERNITTGNNILSPADGKVIYVRKVESGEIPISIKKNRHIPLNEFSGLALPEIEYIIIGIFMFPTSVHVNRAPIEGEVVDIKFKEGLNKPMTITWWRAVLGMSPIDKYSNYILTNERNTILIKNKELLVAVTQIADIYVNKIECWIKKGDKISKGDRYGRIVFGSQVDILIPFDKRVKVLAKEGNMVTAGVTELAVIES